MDAGDSRFRADLRPKHTKWTQINKEDGEHEQEDRPFLLDPCRALVPRDVNYGGHLWVDVVLTAATGPPL